MEFLKEPFKMKLIRKSTPMYVDFIQGYILESNVNHLKKTILIKFLITKKLMTYGHIRLL